MKRHTLLTLLFSIFAGQLFATGSDVRVNEVQACLETRDATLEIQVWDAGIEDNDSIHVLLNGKRVAENLRLRKDRQTLSIPLNPGENELSIFAINLGDIPNNTAAIEVKGQKKVSLHSGMQVNGTLKVLYKTPELKTVFKACPTEYPTYDDDEAKAIRGNPSLQLPSYNLLNTGIRLNAADNYRKVEIQDCYNASSQDVSLLVWDCGVEDNDTVSLYVNGTWVLQNFRLTKAPFAVPVHLNPGENVVLLYAHNLGDIPNNTAALAVKNQYQSQEVGMMISDKNTCGAIRISYGLSDENGVSVPPCLDENKVDSTSEPEIIYLTKINPPSRNNTGTVNRPPVYQPNPRNTNPPVVVPVPTPRPRPIPRPRPVPQPKPQPKPPVVQPTPKPAPAPRKPTTPTPAPKPQGGVTPKQPNY